MYASLDNGTQSGFFHGCPRSNTAHDGTALCLIMKLHRNKNVPLSQNHNQY